MTAENPIREPGYTSASKGWTPLRLLNTHHLRASVAKLQRERPDDSELPDMIADLARRDAEFAETQAQEQSA